MEGFISERHCEKEGSMNRRIHAGGSGVNRIGDHSFVNGKLDTHFMFQKIRQRGNILSEILIVYKI